MSSLEAPLLFEISKKEKAKNEKTIKELKLKIAEAQKGLDEIRNNKIFIGAFEWRIEFPEVLDEDGRFTGFDCVIGNPPYIQLQKMGADANALQKMNYETFERTGDIYCLFYEMGMKLLKPEALLMFITSNGWMKSAYGKSLRSILTSQYQPSLLVDFAGYKVFDSATVDVNILSVIKSNVQKETTACSIRKDDFEVDKLSDYVQTNSVISRFSSSESWSILSDIEQSIKAKIESVGTPLKDWDIQINYGIKTGFNDAFIIDSVKRNEILDACQSEDERQRTAEIIRPILRGRDIKRYDYEFANQYIIATFPSRQYNIDEYQAVREFLLSFGMERLEQTGKEYIIGGEKVKARKKTNNKWFETQDSISYWDDLSKTKIVWIELSDESKFAICEDLVPLNTVFFLTGNHLHHVLGLLNSKLIHWYFTTCLGTSSGVGTNRWLKYTIELLPLAQYSSDDLSQLVINRLLPDADIRQCEKQIDDLICEMYGLSPEEISFINGSC